MVIAEIETLKDNVETIKKVTDASFFVAMRISTEICKDEKSTESKILTSVGMELAAMGGILYNKLKNQLGLLEEILNDKEEIIEKEEIDVLS